MDDRGFNVGAEGAAAPASVSVGTSVSADSKGLDAPSPWLYLGGLVVTLAGLYAVNFGLDDPGFAVVTYGLACTGYLISYVIRVRKVLLNSLRAPLMVLLTLFVVAVLSSDQITSLLVPAAAQEDRFKSLQLVFAWISILHSFLLASDGAVLFACVPCMTMLALVSTRNGDPGIQNAFLAFVGASTFLMVHENYLRTRAARLQGRTSGSDQRFFGGQLQLTAFCLVASLCLANLVAVPIQTVGQTLFAAGLLGAQDGRVSRSTLRSAAVRVSEQHSVSLSTGPGANNELEILHVRCDRPLYWRGATYTVYTGAGFTNPEGAEIWLNAPDASGGATAAAGIAEEFVASNPQVARFTPPPTPFELPLRDMHGGSEVLQEVEVVGGLVQQLYGAGEIESILVDLNALRFDSLGGFSVVQPLEHGTRYLVKSAVVSDDEAILRSASSSRNAIPQPIRDTCLQCAVNGVENPRLRELALRITHDEHTNYDKASAIRQYISKHCDYNLNVASPPGDRDLVEWFLFDSKQGYCNLFAAAMTMLCRYADIPARFASGFITGDAGFQNTYTVRVKDKHDWCEVFLPHVGWLTFDATDGATDITNQGGPQRKSNYSFLAWFFSHGPLPPLTGLVVLGLVGYVIRNEVAFRVLGDRKGITGLADRPLSNLKIIQLYAEACRLLARSGVVRGGAMTPDEYAAYLVRTAIGTAFEPEAVIGPLTEIYSTYRYGPAVAGEADVVRARQLVTRLQQGIGGLRRKSTEVTQDGV